VFCYNLARVARYSVAGKEALAPGAHTIVYDFQYDGGGIGKGGLGTMQVDGKKAATGRIERTLPFRMAVDETLDTGEDTGTPATEDYRVPFRFTGEIKKVVIDLAPATLSALDHSKVREGQAKVAAAASPELERRQGLAFPPFGAVARARHLVVDDECRREVPTGPQAYPCRQHTPPVGITRCRTSRPAPASCPVAWSAEQVLSALRR
jgi:hypothetical protein